MDIDYNVFDLLDRPASTVDADRPALTFEGETRTFAELRTRSLKAANALIGLGVGPGDRVAVLMSNRHEWPEVFFGLAAIGAICVPVNVLLRGPEVRHVCSDSAVETLIVDRAAERALSDLEEIPDRVVTVGEVELPEGLATTAYERVFEAAPDDLPQPRPKPTDTFIHYYTSGTTGLPKAAVHTHSGVLWNSFTQIPDLGLDRDVTYLCVPSLSWAAGFHDLVLALIWVGGRSVLMPTGGATVERILETVAREGVTHTFLVPTLLKQLATTPELQEKAAATRLRWVITGSEPVPADVIESLNRALPGCEILQGYGLSEFPTVTTSLKPHEALSHVGKAGRPLSIVTMAVRTDEDEIVPVGEGEILLRSPATMKGYLNRPDATAEALRDGWLHTGDLGRVDEEGYLTVTGRKKDMIISGGLNIYPREIEDVIHTVEGVVEVAVVGIEDEQWGEVPVAVVVCGDSRVSAELIDSTCRRHLATFKCPKRILHREEPLPRNVSGKIVKGEIKPWAAERARRLAA